MIAAFLGLRLYSVLGRRAEHEEEPLNVAKQARFDLKQDGTDAARAAVRAQTDRAPDRVAALPQQPRPREMAGVSPAAERGLREIVSADRRFDVLAFLEGARGAYRMILEAFWRGDKQALAQMCDASVYASFAAAIDARLAAGEVLENRLVRIEDAVIVDAEIASSLARVTVRFNADVAAVTRDAQGMVIAGSLTDAVEARDLWTFERDIRSASPDWLLDETDEA